MKEKFWFTQKYLWFGHNANMIRNTTDTTGCRSKTVHCDKTFFCRVLMRHRKTFYCIFVSIKSPGKPAVSENSAVIGWRVLSVVHPRTCKHTLHSISSQHQAVYQKLASTFTLSKRKLLLLKAKGHHEFTALCPGVWVCECVKQANSRQSDWTSSCSTCWQTHWSTCVVCLSDRLTAHPVASWIFTQCAKFLFKVAFVGKGAEKCS